MENIFQKIKSFDFKTFFTSPSYPRTIALIGIVILAVALPVTITVLQQRTQTQQHAMVSDGGGSCSSGGQSCGTNADCCSGLYCTRSGKCANQCTYDQHYECSGTQWCLKTTTTDCSSSYGGCQTIPGTCGLPKADCQSSTETGTCYTNNSCPNLMHEITPDKKACDSGYGYRICCAQGEKPPLYKCKMNGGAAPNDNEILTWDGKSTGKYCASWQYCDDKGQLVSDFTTICHDGFTCKNSNDPLNNELLGADKVVEYNPKQYCPTHYYCLVDPNSSTAKKSPGNGKVYETNNTNICHPYKVPTNSDTCASSTGTGICMYHSPNDVGWQTVADLGQIPCSGWGVPGTVQYNNCQKQLPTCADAIPGTVGGSDSVKHCAGQNGNDFKCCIYTNQGSSGSGGDNKTQCEKDGGKCQLSTSSCDGTIINSACQPGPGISCCKPNSSSGGGGETCTNGQQTKFVLKAKMEGIGNGAFENPNPKTPNGNGVLNGRVTVKNGSTTLIGPMSMQFTYSSADGTFNSPAIDLGTSKISCGGKATVTVKINRYVPATVDVAYATTTPVGINPIQGDNNLIVNGEVRGDDKVTIEDYNAFRICPRGSDPDKEVEVTGDTVTYHIACRRFINFFYYPDGGATADEWAFNYNLWLRGLVKYNSQGH